MSETPRRISLAAGESHLGGSDLLDASKTFISRFCAFPDEHSLVAVTLWAAHTHMASHFYSTPRLALISPEPSSGKTRVLEVLDLLVSHSMFAFNASPAAIFRTLEDGLITLLLDEVDAIWGSRRKDEHHEDLRALLNAGYKRGASIPRCVGPNHIVQHFQVFCPVAMAGIGNLPDTIISRSVIIRMRRRAPDERVEPFKGRLHAAEGNRLRQEMAEWADFVGETVGNAWPDMPPGVEDRNEEIWEPLLAVADAAGGEWPRKTRAAAMAFVNSAEVRDSSLGLRLLSDLRSVFVRAKQTKLSTAYLLDELKSPRSGLDDDAPWEDLYGHGITPRNLAKLLRPYGIRSKKVRTEGSTLQGYTWDDLFDAFQRYLPAVVIENGEHAEQEEQSDAPMGGSKAPTVPESPPCTDQNAPLPEHCRSENGAVETNVPDVPDVPENWTGDGEIAEIRI